MQTSGREMRAWLQQHIYRALLKIQTLRSVNVARVAMPGPGLPLPASSQT